MRAGDTGPPQSRAGHLHEGGPAGRRVRILLLFIVVALAGCVAEDGPEGPDLIGVCPQWIAVGEPSTQERNVTGQASLSVELPLEVEGRPLDLLVFTVTSDAPVTLKAFREDGRRLLLRDEGSSGLPSVQVDGEREVRTYLSPVEHGSEPAPGIVRLSFEGTAAVTVIAEPFYRVCGVPGP